MRLISNRLAVILLLLISLLPGCAFQGSGIRIDSAVLSADGETAEIMISETRPGALKEADGQGRLSVVHRETGVCISFPHLKDLSIGRISIPNHGKLLHKGDWITVAFGKISSAPALLE